MKTMNATRSRWMVPAVITAALLAFTANVARTPAGTVELGFTSPAAAQGASLKDVGEKFRQALFGGAKACRNEIKGLNVDSIKGVVGCLWKVLKNAAKEGVILLARVGWNTLADLLKTKGGPAAQKFLGNLVGKLTKFVPGLGGVAKAAVDALGTGTGMFADGVKACGVHITAISMPVLKKTLSCTWEALKKAGAGAALALAKNLWNELADGITRLGPKAATLVDKLVSKIPIAALRNIAGPLKAAIGTGSELLGGEVKKCGSKITTISLDVFKSVFQCGIAALKTAGKGALLALAKGLWGELANAIEKGGPAAGGLVDKLMSKLPIKSLASLGAVLKSAIGTGAGKLATDFRKCGDKITAISGVVFKAVFNCGIAAVKSAAKATGIAVVQGLWDEMVNMIGRNCTKAADLLGGLANKVAAVFGPAKALAATIGTALKSGCQGVTDKVANLNPVR